MKYKNLLLIFSLLLFSTSFGYKNESNNDYIFYFVQFKINTISTAEDQARVNKFMLSKADIVVSRANAESSVYFCYIKIDSKLTEIDFVNWFKELGLTISCFNKGIENKDIAIPQLELKNCK